MPTNLFYTVIVPCSIWILNRNKKKKGKTLFIDARDLGSMVTRKIRELNEEDIDKIANTYHNFQNNQNYIDISGFCKVATIDEIKDNNYVLTPGRFVGTKEQENDGIHFEEKMKTTKNTLIDKDYVKIRKDTFDSMNNVIKETKKVMEFQPKTEQLFNTFSKSHQTLEKENNNLQREVKALTTRNQNLTKENNNLKTYLKVILEAIKHFFRELLQIGNDKTKEVTTSEIKDYYDNKDFDSNDVYDISKGTTKEDELFDYASVPSYLKISKKSNSNRDKGKDDYEMSL